MAASKSTRWFSALAILILFVLLAWLLGAVLPLGDGERVALRVALLVLGLVGAAAILWYLRPQDEPLVAAAPPGKGDDALVAVRAARARLPRGTFDNKPMVLVAGTTGSCKTSIVLHGGINPELLAGDAPVSLADAAPSTAAANLWLTSEALVVEPGGDTFADAARWRRFVHELRPPRLAAAVGRGTSAPRTVVVCVSCDVFFASGGGAELEALARMTRERLADAVRELGIALPVYVVFTKADRIPDFEAWVASLTNDEVKSPVGAALPFDTEAAAGGAGSYESRVVARIDDAFATVVSSLAKRRGEMLERISDTGQRLTAYELPRSLGKLAPAVTSFLAEICRPTQLGLSPQLRGFYFTGARPVAVDYAPTAPAASQRAVEPSPVAGATSLFSRDRVAAASARAAAPAVPSSRRVPQWVFLSRLFPGVIFGDRGARTLAAGGVRVARLRRAMLAAGIVAVVVVGIGELRSWLGNRGYAERTTLAARDVAALPVVTAPSGTIAFPSADALRRLDALRTVLDTLRGYEAAGVPMHLRWGLWHGGALLASGRRVWLRGYDRELHAAAWSALVDSLRSLPAQPRASDDYGYDYALLKAYLIGTVESRRSTPEFMAPVLLRSFARGQTLDADVAALARRQFEFYATELARDNPFPQAADASLVRQGRDFLGHAAGSQQIYQYMLSEAGKVSPPARLALVAPQSVGIVVAPDVQGVFTAKGWSFMQDAFVHADRYFQGETWVTGDAGQSRTQNRDAILADLRTEYHNDYVAAWQSYVRSIAMTRAGTARDVAAKLGVLGSGQSPLFAAFALAARNAPPDSSLAAAFQPLKAVTSPKPDTYVFDGNQKYLNGLLDVQAALEQVAPLLAAADTQSVQALTQAAQQGLTTVAQAKVAARQMQQGFAGGPAATQTGASVEALLLAPLETAEGVLRAAAATRPSAHRVMAAAPKAAAGAAAGATAAGAAAAPSAANAATANAAALAAGINERARALCDAMTPMLAKFPFNANASGDASIGELRTILAPGTGTFWTLQQEKLDGVLVKQGNVWIASPTSPVPVSAAFVAFFNRAAQVSKALFSGGADPHLVFTAHAVVNDDPRWVTLSQGSQSARFEKNTPPAQFVWPSSTGRDVKLTGQYGRRERLIAQATGDWAVFHLLAQAASSSGEAAVHAEWTQADKNARPVAVDFVSTNGSPVFARGWLDGMVCAPQVTR